ncbi:MAG: S1-C subfamily serine protease [Polaribacter sp.]|jgi:S1-C subfamily serine protease
MALIPPFFMDTVVAMGIQQSVNGKVKKTWVGTGFLFGQYVKTHDDPKKKDYTVFLVTNKHVIANQSQMILRFNPQNAQPAKDYNIRLMDDAGKLLWTGHQNPKVDVAVLRININLIAAEGMKFGLFKSDTDIATRPQMMEHGLMEGDFIYALGFPMGLVSKDRQHVMVRSGIIARIRDLYENRSTDFTVDAFVFPGNSGGPVITKPEVISIQGTQPYKKASLIGIIKSYIPYRDVAISQQTKNPRVIFEENTGLSLVEPVDHILDAIRDDLRKEDVAKL